MKTETLSFETANGPTTAFAARPETANADSKTVILIQEWWGLNDHIKDVAGRYAEAGFIAVAPDLYRGKLAANPQEAAKLMNGLALDDGVDTIKCAVAKAEEAYGVSRFAVSGYCMGGTFSLRAACELDLFSAAAPFYGDVPEPEVLQKLKTPVLFISGLRDGWITPEKVAGLEKAAAEHNLPVESVAYDADHAFCNNTRPEVYDAEAAQDAWRRVITFFNNKL